MGIFRLFDKQAVPQVALKELEVKYTQRQQRPFKLSDGGGPHLLVQPSGSKLWRLKYRFDGKEKLLSFGKYPGVSLAAARKKRQAAKELLVQSIDPGAVAATDIAVETDEAIPKDPPADTLTFEAIARAWHANREEGLDRAHAGRLLRRLERDAFPDLGRKPISEITAPEILAVIRKVEARGALDVSRRLKQSISQVFRFAIASGWASGCVRPSARASVENSRCLPPQTLDLQHRHLSANQAWQARPILARSPCLVARHPNAPRTGRRVASRLAEWRAAHL